MHAETPPAKKGKQALYVPLVRVKRKHGQRTRPPRPPRTGGY
jgi:hypothetical protein